MGRITKSLKTAGLTVILVASYTFYGQTTNEHINTGGITTNTLSFSVGEIFVIEEKSPSEEVDEVYQHVKAIPNPTGDAIYLKFENEIVHNLVEVYDISGRLVSTQNISDSKVDFSAMANGTYLIKSPLNEFRPIKILKQ